MAAPREALLMSDFIMLNAEQMGSNTVSHIHIAEALSYRR